jgi:alginate O-acetyltransferase complex protein AlgI
MSFDTVTFWLFFPLAWMAWRLTPLKIAKAALLIFSLIFYAWWDPWYVLLLIGPTAIDYIAGQRIYDATNQKTKRLWLTLALSSNLGILAFFKYGGFILKNGLVIGTWLGWHATAPHLNWFIPLGISFYTFQVMSYSLDIYRGILKPASSFVSFLQFICFFPHLVAGPIVRAHELLPQFQRRRPLSPAAIQGGIYYIIWGLFMKMVVADSLAGPVDAVFSPGGLDRHGWVSVWLAVIFFSTEIFADFAGYSAIAVGLAMLMGIKFPRNFNYPYISASLAEFWMRWHITLSRWLRDYLYIPLGGNRLGKQRTYANLMLTMLLGGLWHGASWTFVAWGAMHGVGLCIERSFRNRARLVPHNFRTDGRIPFSHAIRRLLSMICVFIFLLITWVFFRSQTFSQAIAVLNMMFLAPFHAHFLWPTEMNGILMLLGAVALLHLGQLLHEWFGIRSSPLIRSTVAAAMFLAVLIVQRPDKHVFIYFQF